MKNYLYPFITIIVIVTSLSFVSCSDDDDDFSSDKKSKGKVVVEYVGATNPLRTYYAKDAVFNSGHQELNGTVLDYLRDGATFHAMLHKDGDDSFIEWQFETSDEISVGKELEISSNHWGEPQYDNAGYFCLSCEGVVFVKSIKDNKVTLQFRDFTFERIKRFSVGNSSYQDLIVNGEMTFTYEDIFA